MKRNRRRWFWIGIVAILVAFLCVRQWMLPKSLLDQATPVTGTKDWGLSVSPGLRSDGIRFNLFKGRFQWSSAYQWLDREKILFFRQGPTFSTWELSQYYHYGGTAAVYDCSARQISDLTRFNTHFVSSQGNPYCTKSAPDGNWILWSQSDGGQGYSGLYAATQDGKHYIHWPDEGAFYWLESGQSLVEYQRDYQTDHSRLTIRSISHPEKREKIVLRDFPEDSILKAVSSDRHLYAINFEEDRAKEEHAEILTLLDQDFQSEAGKLLSYPIRFPTGSWVKEVVYLPAKHKIAWLLASAQTDSSPMEKALQYVFPRHISTYRTESLWISSLQGKNLREIGRTEIKQVPEMQSGDPGIYFLRWVPDGTRLSFVYKDCLYTVPVD